MILLLGFLSRRIKSYTYCYRKEVLLDLLLVSSQEEEDSAACLSKENAWCKVSLVASSSGLTET